MPEAEAEPGGPETHVVQEGENLTIIADRYGVSVFDLMLVNGLDEDDVIQPGQELLIPGAEGVAVPTTYQVEVGDTLPTIAARFATTPAAVAGANRLVSADSLYAGQTLAVISNTGTPEPRMITGTLHVVRPGDTLLTVAARYGLSPAEIAAENELLPPVHLYTGMRLRIPLTETANFAFLPGAWRTILGGPLPLLQGRTVGIYVENDRPGTPEGLFAGQPLHFAPHEGGFVALVGLDAFSEPGRYPLVLRGAGEEAWWPFEQEVEVLAAGYPTQTINVSAELAPLLAPEVRAEEDAFLSTIYGQFTPEPYWEGLFQAPVTNTIVTAGYGGARSYNGGPFEIFHTGVDYAGTVGTPIVAPAAGTIVFSDTLELRGGTVIVDHGLGVMSGYYHLSEILVKVGEQVEAGQIIARGGNTGLSTGPHLHWELRIMDVPVDGRQWTQTRFPPAPEPQP